MPTTLTPLRDIAKVVRSKNAGPFEITLDIIFKSREDFDAVKKSGVITKELISSSTTCQPRPSSPSASSSWSTR